jgi:hypothetical protein
MSQATKSGLNQIFDAKRTFDASRTSLPSHENIRSLEVQREIAKLLNSDLKRQYETNMKNDTVSK